ncbi:NADAR family protein [Vibrio coralliirubri]|uniref:NADAR family protein n=1 Tax=Vibrio coralliirubri TaxID=1516159 RepID=UPI0022850196|nr:NADAR family protein [Vibrio coralliirubri]MCY9865011.1 NADAR family protein [Vibrio coralliirubri]
MKITDKYVFFFTAQDIFSQWHPSPFTVRGYAFKTAEHYMMFYKAKYFGDHQKAQEALEAPTPKQAKAIGKLVTPFIKSVWDTQALVAVKQASLAKFRQNKTLRAELLRHAGKTFVEASSTDCLWGVGLAENDPRILDPKNWRGKNQLGVILTEVAKELAIEFAEEHRQLLSQSN